MHNVFGRCEFDHLCVQNAYRSRVLDLVAESISQTERLTHCFRAHCFLYTSKTINFCSSATQRINGHIVRNNTMDYADCGTSLRLPFFFVLFNHLLIQFHFHLTTCRTLAKHIGKHANCNWKCTGWKTTVCQHLRPFFLKKSAEQTMSICWCKFVRFVPTPIKL